MEINVEPEPYELKTKRNKERGSTYMVEEAID